MITFSCAKVRVCLTFGFFFAAALTSVRDNSLGALSLLFCIAHELGHLFAMRVLGARVAEIRLYGGGISISAEDISTLGKPSQAAVYFAGPAVNLVLAAVLGGTAGAINLFLAVFNLLPLGYFDGGKLLALVCRRPLGAVSALCTAALAAVVILSAIRYPASLSPSSLMTLGFIVLSYFLDN